MGHTLADVARAAGVDTSTASRVLRGESSQRVKPETRERILQAVRDLDYRPNAVAKALRLARSSTIGMVLPQLNNPVFSEVIAGAEAATSERGYSLLISYRTAVSDTDVYRRLTHTNRIDGLLVASFDADEELVAFLKDTDVPVVMINRLAAGVAHGVALNGRRAAEMATNHLLDLGHRRIAHLAGRQGGFNRRERLEGYQAALQARGIPLDDSLVLTAGYTAEGAIEATRALIARGGSLPTAIFAATVLTAAGAIRVLLESGIRVPEDISVIGLHDAEFAAILYPPLTTVKMPNLSMGSLAARMVIDLIDGTVTEPRVMLEPEELVLRASTAPPRPGA
ncbi:MAG: LacI family DNA-binding transcriptional regulator [Candidatus Kaistia colombiensis]|nr:MAG: LacI family DNA-binding transcriptional regulator [Kaistia sp.]